jgi:hypothetical protein
MQTMRSLLIALALGAGAVSPAHARAAELVRVAAAPDRDVDRLAELLLPDSAAADLATRASDHAIDQGLIGDSASRQLYARYPGLRAHVAEKLRPGIEKLLKRELPSLRDEMAKVLATELTPQEVAQTADFFASPAGMKVQATVLRTIGEKPGLSEQAAQEAAMNAVFSSLALADYPAVIGFASSSAGSKLNRINPRLTAASKAWADRLVRENGRKMSKVAARATRKFVRQADRRKA